MYVRSHARQSIIKVRDRCMLHGDALITLSYRRCGVTHDLNMQLALRIRETRILALLPQFMCKAQLTGSHSIVIAILYALRGAWYHQVQFWAWYHTTASGTTHQARLKCHVIESRYILDPISAFAISLPASCAVCTQGRH